MAKTKPTGVSVESYLAAIPSDTRRADCETLIAMMSKATKAEPKMWGSSIVGFGELHYRYASGREGDTCLIGFSSRKPDLVLYLGTCLAALTELLGELGPHSAGKGCLYIRQIADVKKPVLKKLIARAVKTNAASHVSPGN